MQVLLAATLPRLCSLLVDAHLIVIQIFLSSTTQGKSHGVQTLKVHEQTTYICCVVCVSCVLMLWLVVFLCSYVVVGCLFNTFTFSLYVAAHPQTVTLPLWQAAMHKPI